MKDITLAAFSVRPRSIAMAIFQGIQLKHIRVRELRSSPEKARDTITELVMRALQEFDVNSCAITAGADRDTHADHFIEHVQHLLRNAGLPFRLITYESLLNAYSIPALATRRELRESIIGIWPNLRDHRSPAANDSAATGLLAQVQSLLDINLTPT